MRFGVKVDGKVVGVRRVARSSKSACGEVTRSGEAIGNDALNVDVAATKTTPELDEDVTAGPELIINNEKNLDGEGLLTQEGQI